MKSGRNENNKHINDDRGIDLSSQKKDKLKIISNDARIYTEVKHFLNELSSATISFPFIGKINFLDQLKKIKRNGKVLRLKNFKNLDARTVYDHILALARLADALYVLDKANFVTEEDIPELGRLIAYHEINEVLLGDIPAYTHINNELLERLNNINQVDRELRANNFIWMFLNNQQRISIESLNNYLKIDDQASDAHVMQFFRMLDQIEPIIAVWRYLYHYNSDLNECYDNFIYDMSDFFLNDRTLRYRKDNDLTVKFPYTKILLDCLCNKKYATDYARKMAVTDERIINTHYEDIFRYLVEQIPLFAPSDENLTQK